MPRQSIFSLNLFRRKYLVNAAFQVRFILYSVGMALFVIAAVYVASEYFFWEFFEGGRNAGLSDDDIFFTFLERQRQVMNRVLLFLAIGLVLILSLCGLLLSHRVAGPLYRLNLHMLAVAAGKTSEPLKFRKKDFFKELASAYNAQYEYLKFGVRSASSPKNKDKSS